MNYRLIACKRSLLLLAGCLILMAGAGEKVAYGQEPNPNPVEELKSASGGIRFFVRQEIFEAAGDFHLTLQPNNFTVLSRDDVFAVGANLAGVEHLGLDDLRNGADVGFIFFYPQVAQPFLPTGFYLVRVFTGPDSNAPDTQARLPRRVDLIDEDGNPVATLPLTLRLEKNISSATPIQTIKADVDAVEFDIHWNVRANKSVNLSFAVPLNNLNSH